jgi:hypothetical protein
MAQEHKHHTPKQEQEDETVQEVTAKDQAELDEDVSCCLAEIDEVLAEVETERERAEREFTEIQAEWEYLDKRGALAVWQARYAHLGLSVDYNCCTGEPYIESE